MLTFVKASDGGESNNGEVSWKFSKPINPGESKTLTVEFSIVKEGIGDNTLSLDCTEGVKRNSTCRVVIAPTIEIVKFEDSIDPVIVGKETEFEIVIENKGAVKVTDVKAVGKAPEEMEIEKVTKDEVDIQFDDKEEFTISEIEIDAGAQ